MLPRRRSPRLLRRQQVETVERETFPSMFATLDTDASLLGIMAIENAIAGSIPANHELLRLGHHRIIGEYKMRISHVLAALPRKFDPSKKI